MRILCLIMVGAFLLTIAIAENGDSQRVNDKPQGSMVAGRSLSQSMNVPWLHRASENGPTYGFPNNIAMPDSIASPAISVPQYLHREHKSTPGESSMILEPMHQHRSPSPSWMDWISNFLGDDPPPGPGPIIGPIDFPGLSRNLFIRQHEPLDEDTNHVVIHLINRQGTPTYSTEPAALAQLPLGHNQISYYEKNPSQLSSSFYTNPVSPVKSPEFDYATAQFPYKLVEGNPWKLQTQTSNDKEIKDKKSQYPFFEAPTGISSKKTQFSRFSTNSKLSGYPQPSIAWSQRYDGQPIRIDSRGQYRNPNYGRSTESKGPVMFPAPSTSTPSTKQEQSYAWHRKYGYQNNTNAPGETVRSASAILRAKLDEISAANRRQAGHRSNASSRVSRTSDVSSRQPRNRFSHFDAPTTATTTTSTTTTQRSPVYIHKPPDLELVTKQVSFRKPRNRLPHVDTTDKTQRSPVYIHKASAPESEGVLVVVQAPHLDNSTDSSTGKKSDDVMQSIMSMTASQQWKNVSSNIVDTMEKMPVKPVEAERRVDIVAEDEKQTKEEITTTSTTTTSITVAQPVRDANKGKADMRDAVEKIMSSFSQWRYKVVSTNFLKELDNNESNEAKMQR